MLGIAFRPPLSVLPSCHRYLSFRIPPSRNSFVRFSSDQTLPQMNHEEREQEKKSQFFKGFRWTFPMTLAVASFIMIRRYTHQYLEEHKVEFILIIIICIFFVFFSF
jgi:transposase